MAALAVIDAPLDSSGTGRGEERAPAALRAAGLLERLGARDAGEADARIRDPRREERTGVVGASSVRRAASAIASRVHEVLERGERPLVLGGDCTLLLGVFQALAPGSGLWFVDGHADFFDGESSPSGEAADMDLAILTGHGPPGLLEGEGALLEPAAVVLLGHRPSELHPDVARENARLDPAIHALTAPQVRAAGPDRVGSEAAARLAGRPAWLHLDLDVLDEDVLPAVSYPQPGGLGWDELIALARPLVSAPNLLGISLADYNPERDPGGTHAARTVEALASLLYPAGMADRESPEKPQSDESSSAESESEGTARQADDQQHDAQAEEHPQRKEHAQGMVPGRERRRSKLERGSMRVIATAGIIGIAVALGAVLVGQDVEGWIVGLAVGLTSVILAALLWSSRQL